jgi:anti-sigma regulatory factor (Ser/Thr protein kinase)
MTTYVRAIYSIDAKADGPARARRIVAEELGELVSPPILENLQLLVSELVTNGIVHGAGTSKDTVMLDLLADDGVRCAVIDHGPGFIPSDPAREHHGMGLKIVEQLADRWGVVRSQQETRVWFELASHS